MLRNIRETKPKKHKYPVPLQVTSLAPLTREDDALSNPRQGLTQVGHKLDTTRYWQHRPSRRKRRKLYHRALHDDWNILYPDFPRIGAPGDERNALAPPEGAYNDNNNIEDGLVEVEPKGSVVPIADPGTTVMDRPAATQRSRGAGSGWEVIPKSAPSSGSSSGWRIDTRVGAEEITKFGSDLLLDIKRPFTNAYERLMNAQRKPKPKPKSVSRKRKFVSNDAREVAVIEGQNQYLRSRPVANVTPAKAEARLMKALHVKIATIMKYGGELFEANTGLSRTFNEMKKIGGKGYDYLLAMTNSRNLDELYTNTMAIADGFFGGRISESTFRYYFGLTMFRGIYKYCKEELGLSDSDIEKLMSIAMTSGEIISPYNRLTLRERAQLFWNLVNELYPNAQRDFYNRER